ncbi:MFS transporter [Hymenobacter caeli]|uniref:Maltose/moltooligosaccharide transporter n=1 Tax=Hymenobacter caeli TaxID=2735894 RepID=A0ABX2FUK2_9BACT|nr:MFS transporter [Hymenobacter caeli]NRT20860.1 maltose/moltooligosaccharide transporter [Hymenobacter caeli]
MALSAAAVPTTANRLAALPFGRILSMNVGFFGLQYSFGLQQTNMSPIYTYLGADPDKLPYLWLAGPLTGLLVQPIIGALSDRTTSRWGRRTPYFIAGAIICSVCLLVMPFSRAVWMAASILWILDAANNVTMEPYRAFVSDQLPAEQHATGFLTQSFFTGLGITLANFTPSVLVYFGWVSATARSSNNIPYTTYVAFFIGGVVSIGAILYSVFKTREQPLDAAAVARIRATPGGLGGALREIGEALRDMPRPMRQMAPMMLFSWYGIFCYWQYITLCLARTVYHTADAHSAGFAAAQLLTGRVNGTYNIVTFCSAFALAALARRLGARAVHLLSLAAAGLGLLALPGFAEPAQLLWPMLGLGIGWASMMGTTYALLASSIPKARTGVYMGIFNLFIVVPMLLQTLSFSWVYRHLLAARPENAIRLAGALLLAGGVAVLLVRPPSTSALDLEESFPGEPALGS